MTTEKGDISRGTGHRHRGKFTEDLVDSELILKTLRIEPGQDILDAGCGNGYMSKRFSKAVGPSGTVWALDPDEYFIGILKRETQGTNIEAIEGDISRPTQLRESSVDLIYISTVIHGFSQKQMQGFLREAKRLLKPNAFLAIVEIEKRETPFGPPMESRYSPEELKEIVALVPVNNVQVGEYFYMQVFQNKDRSLLLGVTGGIATGKTTVVRMLEEMGAPVIDFDLLAREVVEPGKLAWKDIVAYFGEEILLKDGSLDREKLSEIVFQDEEKRKKLEAFTHPRIYEASDRQVKMIVEEDPNAIVQLDIPLLIEQNLQHMVHKVLVVYIPREKQIERLIERDGMSRKGAVDRLRAQRPIDEKLSKADFVIYNERTLEETEKQVEDLWQVLKDLQRQGSRKRNLP